VLWNHIPGEVKECCFALEPFHNGHPGEHVQSWPCSAVCVCVWFFFCGGGEIVLNWKLIISLARMFYEFKTLHSNVQPIDPRKLFQRSCQFLQKNDPKEKTHAWAGRDFFNTVFINQERLFIFNPVNTKYVTGVFHAASTLQELMAHGSCTGVNFTKKLHL